MGLSQSRMWVFGSTWGGENLARVFSPYNHHHSAPQIHHCHTPHSAPFLKSNNVLVRALENHVF